jgi:hypothetical protein
MKLQFGATPSKEILGYCDADWGVILKTGCPPQGLFSLLEGEPFLGIANDTLQ